jgi:hypothetical protein
MILPVVDLRLPRGSRAFLALMVILAAVTGGHAMAQLPARPVMDPAAELAAIKGASELDSDPADAQAVRDICTACHASSQFLGTPRSSTRWEQLFGQMAQLGARPDEEQIDRIVRYFQRNLTVVNVNTSPDEELGPTLQTSPEVTTAITLRRLQRKFTGIAELAAVPGVDRAVLVRLKDRLQF